MCVCNFMGKSHSALATYFSAVTALAHTSTFLYTTEAGAVQCAAVFSLILKSPFIDFTTHLRHDLQLERHCSKGDRTK